jgi:hypothetical protein
MDHYGKLHAPDVELGCDLLKVREELAEDDHGVKLEACISTVSFNINSENPCGFRGTMKSVVLEHTAAIRDRLIVLIEDPVLIVLGLGPVFTENPALGLHNDNVLELVGAHARRKQAAKAER